MRIEDLKNWTIEQIKSEVIRLADECEKKQHEIIDLREEKTSLQNELDKMCKYNEELRSNKTSPESKEIFKKLHNQHNEDCKKIREMRDTITTLADLISEFKLALRVLK